MANDLPIDLDRWLKTWREAALGSDFDERQLRRLAEEYPEAYLRLSSFVKDNHPHLLTGFQ